MDLTSSYFPIRVKQEPLDETYEPSGYHTGLYSNSYGNIKQENRDAYSHTIAEADSATLTLENVNTSKKRIRKKKNNKQTLENGSEYSEVDMGKGIKQEKITDTFKERKKVDRFNGMPEEEVVKRTLPDHLVQNLDIVVIGINPGLFAAYKGHHYAGPGNHFWKCLFLSGLIPEPMTSDDDFKLIEYGIGFTNIVARTTRGSADLTRKEIRDGAGILLEKLQKYKPKIAVFNGKGIYEVFSGKKNFDFGKQPECIDGTSTVIFVMPSSSARCAQLPRAIDKVPFYEALKKLRDHMNGKLPGLQESEVTFPDVKLKIESDDGIKTEPLEIKEENSDRQMGGMGHMMHGFSNGDMQQAASSVGDADPYSSAKPKKYKKKSKKRKSDDEDVVSSPTSQIHPQQQQSHQPSPQGGHHHQQQVMGQPQQQPSSLPNQPPSTYMQTNYTSDPFADPPAPMAMRVKQEKADDMMYAYAQNQQQQQGCNYGGYPPPPAHSGSYYGSPSYGSYPPAPSHPSSFVSSGSLNQLESFVDQIPNIGPSMVPPPAHGASYPPPPAAGQAPPVGPPHYAQGSMTYPPPPPAHEHQVNSSSYSPNPNAAAMGYSYPGANPPPAHSPTFVGSQNYCPENYQPPRSPVYTDLDSVQVKQERLDPAYGSY